jgi:membrane protease YdiL (CAAX protease family)
MSTEGLQRNLWQEFRDWWMKLSPIKFIVFTNILMIGLTLLLSPIMVLMGFDENTDIGGPDFGDFGPVVVVLLAVLIAPLLETIIFQYPILLLKRWTDVRILIFFSAAFFAVAHADYSKWYALVVFPMGLVLAYTIDNYRKGWVNGFWATVFVHAFRNGIAMIPYFLMQGSN